MTETTSSPRHAGEEGYLLIGLVVVCFLLVLTLGIAAPRVAKQLERDREVESEHRAQEYVRAIQLYYKKNNRYPNSVEELLGNPTGGSGMSLGGNAMNVRFLRQKYKDPLTGGEYRLIHFGEAKTEVKGFFGEPLQGMAAGNLGAASGMQSTGSGFGTSVNGGGFGSPAGSLTNASPASGTAATGVNGIAGTGTPGSSIGSSTSATTFQGSKGAIIGVGSDAKGHGLVEWNGSANIEDWEFLYDPRVEQLKAKVSIFGGSPAANGSGSLGSGFAPVGGTTGLGGTGSSTNGSGTTPGSAGGSTGGGSTTGTPNLP